MRSVRGLVLAIAFLSWPVTGRTQDAQPTLPFCPVRTNKPGLPEFKTEYRGKTIHFCCEECVRAFKDNPRVFAGGDKDDPSTLASTHDWLKDVSDFFERWQLVFTGAIFILLVLLLGLRARQVSAQRKSGPTPALRFLGKAANPGVIISLCLALACAEMYKRLVEMTRQRDGNERANAELHSKVTDQALVAGLIAALPQNISASARGLSKVYYRGNDEKAPELFNNGNYRTCKFLLSVRDESGAAVQVGQTVHGRFSLRIEIERSPNTRNELFSEDVVRKHVLRRRHGWTGTPVFDKEVFHLTTVEPTRRWRVNLPLGAAAEGHTGEVEAIYYFGGDDGSAYPSGTYYIVTAKVIFDEGRILPGSDIVMIELARTESFGLEPVPEVPDDWRPPKN